jgi:hypothetical protein
LWLSGKQTAGKCNKGCNRVFVCYNKHMHIAHNRISFPTHTIVCDPACYSVEYMLDMAAEIAKAKDPTPRQHAKILRHHNNDGTWGIKVNKVVAQ